MNDKKYNGQKIKKGKKANTMFEDTNTLAAKGKRTNNDPENTTQKTKDCKLTKPKVLRKGKYFIQLALFHCIRL
jgi:hypothetical protein